MFRKIWNTLREGDSRTKVYLISVIGLLLGALIMFAVSLATKNWLFVLAAVALIIILAAVARNTVLVVKKGNNKEKKVSTASSGQGKSSKKSTIRVTGDTEEKEFGELQEEEEDSAEGKKKKSKKEKKKEEQEEKERLEREAEDEEEFGDNALVSMTEEKLKRLLLRYKVKQEHVPVVIDLCIPERVRQAPGFAWVDDGKLKILLIERKTRMIERPLSRLQVMEVERGIAVKASGEYVELRDTDLMKKVFTPYLPRYQKKEIGGRTVLLKNLYVLDEDIKFTSTSVNELKKLISFRIEIADRRLADMDLSPYYKKVFVDTFLWRDGILSLQEYKAEVEGVIDSLADPSVPYGEFELTVSALVNSGLLPSEYRNYAMARREEKEKGVSDKKGKKKRRT